jgi:hypothetical protein
MRNTHTQNDAARTRVEGVGMYACVQDTSAIVSGFPSAVLLRARLARSHG